MHIISHRFFPTVVRLGVCIRWYKEGMIGLSKHLPEMRIYLCCDCMGRYELVGFDYRQHCFNYGCKGAIDTIAHRIRFCVVKTLTK